jgi:Recombination endonuclease VII
MTPEQITEMKAAQGGLCVICQLKPCTAVDHCHSTGIVRGMLCNQCNTVLGMMGDDTERLMRAVAYLENSRKIESAPLTS